MDGAEEQRARPAASETAAEFARLVLELQGADEVPETVQGVVDFALQALGCQYAGIALRSDGGKLEIAATTHPAVAEIYQLQKVREAVPLIDCIRHHRTVLVRDTADDDRWADKILEFGVRAILEVPLRTTAGTVGALSLYSTRPDTFGPDAEPIARILGRHATIAIASARREDDPMVAIDPRKLIGQALGILMERYRIDSNQASELLKRSSQQTRTRLIDIARSVVNNRRTQS